MTQRPQQFLYSFIQKRLEGIHKSRGLSQNKNCPSAPLPFHPYHMATSGHDLAFKGINQKCFVAAVWLKLWSCSEILKDQVSISCKGRKGKVFCGPEKVVVWDASEQTQPLMLVSLAFHPLTWGFTREPAWNGFALRETWVDFVNVGRDELNPFPVRSDFLVASIMLC